MKKKTKIGIAGFSVLVAAAACALAAGFLLRGGTWHESFAQAQKFAQFKQKRILLLFSGVAWDGKTESLMQTVLDTSSFKKGMAKDYVLARADFATQEEAYTSALARRYDVRSFPCIYILSPEGFVLMSIPSERLPQSTDGMQELLEQERQSMEQISGILVDIERMDKTGRETDRLYAIDNLFTATNMRYPSHLLPLAREILTLDAANDSGLLGKYEFIVAQTEALEQMRQGDTDGMVNTFTTLCETGHLDERQKQDAYYAAAYNLTVAGSDYEQILTLLQKAFATAPTSAHALDISTAIQFIQQMQEMTAQLSDPK